MSRRTGLRQPAVNESYTEGETVRAKNHTTGEIITGKYKGATKNGTKILIVTKGNRRWVTLSAVEIERLVQLD